MSENTTLPTFVPGDRVEVTGFNFTGGDDGDRTNFLMALAGLRPGVTGTVAPLPEVGTLIGGEELSQESHDYAVSNNIINVLVDIAGLDTSNGVGVPIHAGALTKIGA